MKVLFGLLITVIALVGLSSAVMADDGSQAYMVGDIEYGSWFPHSAVGFDALNPYAQEVAKRVYGYGETGVFYYESKPTCYMNWFSYRVAESQGNQIKTLPIAPYNQKAVYDADGNIVSGNVLNDWYTLPVGKF